MDNAKSQSPIAVDDTGSYTIAIDYNASNNPVYIGKSNPGSTKGDSLWQIRKITYNASNNPIDVQWANGVCSFDKIWDNRVSYTYS